MIRRRFKTLNLRWSHNEFALWSKFGRYITEDLGDSLWLNTRLITIVAIKNRLEQAIRAVASYEET